MELPLSSSFQSKVLASLLSGSININIIGQVFKFFNISGIILVLIVGNSSIRNHRASTCHITILSCCLDLCLERGRLSSASWQKGGAERESDKTPSAQVQWPEVWLETMTSSCSWRGHCRHLVLRTHVTVQLLSRKTAHRDSLLHAQDLGKRRKWENL